MDDLEQLERLADRHGVRPLLAWRMLRAPGVSPAIANRWACETTGRAATDLLFEGALAGALASLDAHGVPALLFKGAALAWTIYPRPDLRPRLDADLLVREADVESADRALRGLGYVPDVQAGTDAVLYQRPYTRPMAPVPHVIDLHWRITNPAVFGEVGTFDELFAESVPVPALGRSVRSPGVVHAMLIACVHRVAHHFDDERLLWLYDIHLLAGRLDATDWQRLTQEATRRQVFEVCRASLGRASTCFGTVVPAAILEAPVHRETSAAYLRPLRPHAQVVFEDLRARAGWHERWRALRSHLFPPASYMREVYAPESASPLAWLYARRALAGARRWLTGSARAWDAR